jgi:hypothetical protein
MRHGRGANQEPNRNPQRVATPALGLQDMHMRRIFVTDGAKKKLLRPCREARALGL